MHSLVQTQITDVAKCMSSAIQGQNYKSIRGIHTGDIMRTVSLKVSLCGTKIGYINISIIFLVSFAVSDMRHSHNRLPLNNEKNDFGSYSQRVSYRG